MDTEHGRLGQELNIIISRSHWCHRQSRCSAYLSLHGARVRCPHSCLESYTARLPLDCLNATSAPSGPDQPTNPWKAPNQPSHSFSPCSPCSFPIFSIFVVGYCCCCCCLTVVYCFLAAANWPYRLPLWLSSSASLNLSPKPRVSLSS